MSSLEIRLYIFCHFLLNVLMSLISLTVAHTPESHKIEQLLVSFSIHSMFPQYY